MKHETQAPAARLSLSETFTPVEVPRRASFRKFLAFFGPGLLVAVGYMDPGNWATDLAGGARYGYALLSVVFLANLLAMLFQHLSLKLGLAAQLDLAQACRARFSPLNNFLLWLLCELAIIACDVAEVIGSAIALKLLFGWPVLLGVALTSLDVMLLLFLQRRRLRWLEAGVGLLILLVGSCFAFELFLAKPVWSEVASGLMPSVKVFHEPGAFYIAVGILGATVMPHNLYLHSSLVRSRKVGPSAQEKRQAIRFATWDSNLALLFAFFINAAILILSAAAFHGSAHQEVADIQDAHRLLSPLLGTPWAGFLFALALLASGQNSTLTGTLAGQVVMEGFLNLRLSPVMRRLLTRGLALLPALVVAAIAGEKGLGKLLIFSQVILSLQLSFALIPLVAFTSDPELMRGFANVRWLRLTAWGAAIFVALLNVALVLATFTGTLSL